mmetsp:Transcript_11037/g.17671  ORF Transcript_11037/g.17671 Transcript_11037/m.17671 type:complete len:132 (+) Transcript_11037:466-861(+)
MRIDFELTAISLNCSSITLRPKTSTHNLSQAKSLVSRFAPLFNRVLIQRVAVETKTASGILLPESAQKALNQGTIVAVGPGGRAADGTKIPMELKVGDDVLLPEYGGQKVQLGSDEYMLYQDNDILGVLSK